MEDSGEKLCMTRRSFACGAGAFAATGAFASAAPAGALEDAKRRFKEAGFGMMAHWGLYSILGGEWRGREPKHPYAEHIMANAKIPLAEYAALARAFNPVLFDPADWMKRARDAGARYFVFTAKHHDGFAMYRSKASAYNVADATPFRRDVVEELAEAARDAGLAFGLYYSQDLDWSDPDGGGLKSEEGRRLWGAKDVRNVWDWTADRDYDFSRYFERKCKPQVEELLTQYGDLFLVWFDTPCTISRAQCLELEAMVRRHQPGCLINGRLGYGVGDYSTPGDNMVDEENPAGRLCETVGTMNGSWGWKPSDQNWKSVAEILAIKAKCEAAGCNYMLNVGPDHLGRIPAAGVSILEGLASARSAPGARGALSALSR